MIVQDNQSIRWLHISDIHIQDPRGPGKQGDQRDVLKDFLRFCAEDMSKKWLFAPDYVFVTGDLAFSGTTKDYSRPPEEGLSVEAFFEDLIDAVPDMDRTVHPVAAAFATEDHMSVDRIGKVFRYSIAQSGLHEAPK